MFKDFLGDDLGGIPAIEFAMLAIPMTLITSCVIQFALLAQTTIVLEQAAFAAARSALVHKCRPLSLKSASEGLFGAAKAVWGGASCNDSAGAAQWENAARIALLPVSASNDKSKSRQGGSCGHPDALVKLMLNSAVRSNLEEAVTNKACYAFEDENVRVDVSWRTVVSGVTFGDGVPAMRAEVTFRAPVLSITRMIFSSGSRGGDKSFYREITAEATVL